MAFEKIQAIIVDKLGLDESEVTMESNLKEELDADSLDLFEIVTEIEEEFNLEVATEDLEQIKTVADMVAYIEKKK